LPNCWRIIFLVLPKLYGCQVGLPNCWSCSKDPASTVHNPHWLLPLLIPAWVLPTLLKTICLQVLIFLYIARWN
jgi:hypothetical protein